MFAAISEQTRGYQLTGHEWPTNSTVTMQLELGSTNVTLIDGLGTWNNSAADALTLWNQHIELVKFNWVSESTAPKGSPDGYNSVFFSSTILGEGFGADTLAVTVVWYDPDNYAVATEADVIFNTAQAFNSYRGPLLTTSVDFHRVALHEFGHVLGLAHVYNYPAGQALMEPYISDLDHLAADDIDGAEVLYSYRITSPTYFSGFVQGDLVSLVFSANNNPTSFTAVGLPAGLQLDPATGKVTGTPVEEGTFQVTITAHGSPRDVSAVVTIEITAASITSFTTVFAEVGSDFSYAITAGNAPISFTATGLPPGLVLDSKTGVISGVPSLSGYYPTAVVAHGMEYDAGGTISFSTYPSYKQWTAQLSPPDQIIRTVQDPVRDRLYVLTNRGLTVVDTKLVSIIANIPVLFGGYDLALSLDGTKIWVAGGTSIQAFSLTDFSALPDIPKGPFYYEQVREGVGNKLYVASGASGSGVYQIDLATGGVTPIRVAMPGYSIGPIIDVSPDGRNLYARFVDGANTISRYDISSGAAVLLGTRTLSTPNLFDLSISPDGKLLSYTTDDEVNGGNNATSIVSATNIVGPATRVDPTSTTGSFNFGTPGSTGYFSTGVNTGYQHQRLDFVSTSSGLPFNEWDIEEGGAAFADHGGTWLFLCGYSTIQVYPLTTDISPGVEPAAKSLLNVSTRSIVGIDDQRMIGGFIITGDVFKQIAFRAIGPSLPLISAMANPAITIYDSAGALVATNQNWNANRDALVSVGLGPWDEHDAGLITTLAPGSYTAVVNIEDGAGGVGLVELYDLSSDNSGHIANISTRSKVGTGDDVLIGGFIVGGKEATNVIARAIGPSLAANNVTGVLLDPVLELYDATGAQIDSNDDWRSNEAEIIATSIPPADDRESAIVTTLQPGAYTAIVRGKNGTTGIALVEIYNLDSAASLSK